MSFFSYFRLRIAQQVLCVSYSVPVAIFLTTAFSPFGTWSCISHDTDGADMGRAGALYAGNRQGSPTC